MKLHGVFNKMLRFLVAFAVLNLADGAGQSSAALNNIFTMHQNKDLEGILQAIKCATVQGSAASCMACYTCDDEKVRGRTPSSIYHLQLKDSNCTTTEVCCVLANHLVARANNDKCGYVNPEGLPRRRRPSLRSVLKREYPWRAWVYSTADLKTPLCSASYIDSTARALLTSASCVDGRSPSGLVVKFTRTQATPNNVKLVIVHDGFIRDTHKNDIAMLILTASPGSLVKPVCWRYVPPNFGTPCIAVSDLETDINMIIPQQESCKNLVKGVESLMCTASPAGDYRTTEGAGVYCLEMDVPSKRHANPKYALYGISLNVHGEQVLSVHTNVTHFAPWIQRRIVDVVDNAARL